MNRVKRMHEILTQQIIEKKGMGRAMDFTGRNWFLFDFDRTMRALEATLDIMIDSVPDSLICDRCRQHPVRIIEEDGEGVCVQCDFERYLETHTNDEGWEEPGFGCRMRNGKKTEEQQQRAGRMSRDLINIKKKTDR